MSEPTAPRRHRNHYFPNIEALEASEMRIVALGTGRPFPRRNQANCSWLVELGNGDKYMFDFGYGSQINFAALEIPYDDVTAYFASHLHVDHVGDFPQIWIGSWVGGRLRPLVVYGPSGTEPRYGFRHFVERQIEAYAWDADTRAGILPAVGAEVDVHEFDYAKTHTVFERNGARVTAFPAIHIYDGAVSYRLDWNGLSFVFSGDTTPNSFFVENGKGADVVVHDAFNTAAQLMAQSGHDRRTAHTIGSSVHSDPAEVGRVFDMIRPRLAVAFHFFNDFDTASEIEAEIRRHYAGRLTLAEDLMVFNVDKREIRVRKAVVAQSVLPNKAGRDQEIAKAARRPRLPMSGWLADKRLFPKD
jgi:ribonuclease Z